ncbi:hypothetical protein [Mediterraneibacter gnavus]|uniref:hypothetical protein n=1 Tax=Mediterraneibacter gnavus TaxID=33038 RepID=UPI0036D3EFCE
MHYQIREGTSREEGAILSLKLPGQGRACRTKKKTLGEAYTVAAIRERIGKEWRSYPVPKPPRLQRCQMHFGRKKHPGDLRISSQSCPGHLPDPEPLCKGKYLCNQSGQYAELFDTD